MHVQSARFALMRRPLLAKEVLDQFHSLTSQDPSRVEPELLRLFSDPLLLEALELASAPLHALTKALLEGKAISQKEKLLLTLYKYLIRLCTRCTPFGLFAGYFTVEIGQSTCVHFAEDFIEKQSRLDTEVLAILKENILGRASIVEQLLFYPNSSLYRVADSYRYMKRQLSGQQTEFILSQAPAGPALESLLKLTNKGLFPAQIKAILQDQHGSKKGAMRYFKALVQAQILVSSLEINVTGQEYFERLKEILQNVKGAHRLSARLTSIQSGIRQGISPEKIKETLQPLAKKHSPSQTLQTQMRIKTNSNQISKQVLKSLERSFSKIAPLCIQTQNPDLEKFASEFYARYGQQKIPLLQALDYDYGIGYGKLSMQSQYLLPLLEGLSSLPPNQNQPKPSHTSPMAQALYQASLAGMLTRIEISGELTKKYMPENDQTALPVSYYVLGSFHTRCQQALDQGDYSFDLKALSGHMASNLLTRFCQGDAALTQKVLTLIKQEEALFPNHIFAEIAHTPDTKAANILQRPALRRYELTYLSTEAGTPSETIRMNDVLVSCEDGKNIVLTSSMLTKPIIPTLSSAHNFSSGLPVYRFLCDLASAHTRSFYWDWGALGDQPFLPRVFFEKLILSKASWKLGPKELSELTADNPVNKKVKSPVPVSKKDLWKTVEKRIGTPRYFSVGQADRILLLDSENEMALTLLAQMLQKQGTLRITEYPEQPGQGMLQQQGLCFTNEIIIPFTQDSSVARPSVNLSSVPPILNKNVTRSFALTSPWLYVKIYGSERLTDSFLSGQLSALCEDLEKQRVIDKWFFIRYHDPSPHIRLRFHSKKKNFWILVLQALDAVTAPLLESQAVISVQTASYERELERYPPAHYEQIESVFHADSKAVLQCLARLPREGDPDMHWLLAMRGTDMLLTAFGLDLHKKITLVEKLHQQFAAELDPGGQKRKIFDQNYRLNSQTITKQMREKDTREMRQLILPLEKRTIKIGNILANNLIQSPEITLIFPDLVHLFLNRWFHSEQRSQEFVIYHYLKKYYCTEMKNKNLKKIFL